MTLMQEWLSGNAANQRTTQWTFHLSRTDGTERTAGDGYSFPFCGHYQLCFCGKMKCKLNSLKNYAPGTSAWSTSTLELSPENLVSFSNDDRRLRETPLKMALVGAPEAEEDIGLPVLRRMQQQYVSG